MSVAQADLQSELQAWMGSSAYVNSTATGSYRSQYGGYWSGGSQVITVPDRQVGQVFSATPSHYSGGCSGIDSELGGFNFVNKDEIVQQMRAIGQNAKVLAFNLAVKYVSALLADTMDWVKDKADFLNQMEMDSCTAAQSVLAAGFNSVGMPSYQQINDAEDREICIDKLVVSDGLTRDQAQQSCNQGGNRNAVLMKNQEHFYTGNLAWYVLMHAPVFAADPNLAQWMMNMTGTLLVRQLPEAGSDGSRKSTWIPGMLYTSCNGKGSCLDFFGKTIMDALIGVPQDVNLKIPIYVCQDMSSSPQACTEVKLETEYFSLSAFKKINISDHLAGNLAGIMKKLATPNAQLSSQEKALIEQAALPLYRYTLASQSFFQRQVPDQDVQRYLRMLAQDLVSKNIEALIAQIRLAFSGAGNNAADDPNMKMYLDYLGRLAAAVSAYEVSAREKMNIELTLLRNAQAYEQALVGKMGYQFLQLVNYRWGL